MAIEYDIERTVEVYKAGLPDSRKAWYKVRGTAPGDPYPQIKWTRFSVFFSTTPGDNDAAIRTAADTAVQTDLGLI